uniref:Uncharacterized protein n=1 Tax=Nelumbo nucifera TaxID=4432 RepID=A0A822YKT5_NELNU|nr:TPA_asm: hypothetical protein HUJ06_011564 [Nelumbo nucifera]
MAVTDAQNPLLNEITCGSLLQKLQAFLFNLSNLKVYHISFSFY